MLFFVKSLLKFGMIVFMGIWAILKLNMAITMFLSMAISILLYAVPFGIWYAVGLCVLLLVHEIGHVIAAKVVGIRVSLPIFIPFLGAMIRLNRVPINAKMAANIAIGGPALGSLSALLCIVFYLWTDSNLMLVFAYMGCILNLFNLIPCEPLDGGKIGEAISPYLWWLGSMIIGGMFFYTYNILIFLIFIFSFHKLWNNKEDKEKQNYYKLSIRQRVKVLCWYIGLICTLGTMTLYIGSLL